MNVRQVVKGQTEKKVTLENVSTESDLEIVTMALEAAREDAGSIFGHTITTPVLDPDFRVVTIHTD